MAESKDNIVTFGLSGMIGKMLVFRSRLGRTFVGSRPKKSSVPPSEAQEAQKLRFAEGITYARAAIADPVVKEMYQTFAKAFQSAFNAAASDFAHGPEIKEIITSAYTGDPGDKILVKATDNYKVARVHVTIKTGSGVLIEQGDAVVTINGLDWEYTATQANALVTGCVVTATAYDLPANTSSNTKTL